jgi:hypothetical protein
LWQNWRRIIHLHKFRCMYRSIHLALFRAPSSENLYDASVNSVTLPFTYIVNYQCNFISILPK